LQLPLYLLAAAERAETRAGLYYMPISQPVVSDNEEDIEGAVAQAFRLKGLTLSDAAVVRASDNALAGGKSAVLYQVEQTGEAEYTGSVCTTAQMESLLLLAKKKSEQTLSRMLEGELAASPAARKKNQEACKYCDYKSVCRFDPKKPGNRIRLLNSIKQDEFFNLIAGGDADGALDS